MDRQWEHGEDGELRVADMGQVALGDPLDPQAIAGNWTAESLPLAAQERQSEPHGRKTSRKLITLLDNVQLPPGGPFVFSQYIDVEGFRDFRVFARTSGAPSNQISFEVIESIDGTQEDGTVVSQSAMQSPFTFSGNFLKLQVKVRACSDSAPPGLISAFLYASP